VRRRRRGHNPEQKRQLPIARRDLGDHGNIYLPLAGGTMTGKIGFSSLPVAPPNANDAVSGIRLSVYEPASGPDYGIGVDAAELWFGVALPTQTFAFYGGNQINARIPPNGSPAVQPYDLTMPAYLQWNTRTMLTANRTYHLSPTGSDTTGDGTVANPWQTLQHVWAWVNAFIDYGGYTVTALMAAGTYTQGLAAFGAQIGTNALGAGAAPGARNPRRGAGRHRALVRAMLHL
jgi:hypothetical protein